MVFAMINYSLTREIFITLSCEKLRTDRKLCIYYKTFYFKQAICVVNTSLIRVNNKRPDKQMQIQDNYYLLVKLREGILHHTLPPPRQPWDHCQLLLNISI